MEVSAFAEIIKAAAVSPLGIVALCCLLFAFIALKFFQNVNQWLRLFVFLLLFGGFVGVFLISTYSVTPIVESPQTAQQIDVDSVPKQSSTLESNREMTKILKQDSLPPTQVPSTPPKSNMRTEVRKVDCGSHWTGWIEVGGGVGSPCPEGCYRGDELGQSYRSVGFPPRVQTKHKFQCWRDEQVTVQ